MKEFMEKNSEEAHGLLSGEMLGEFLKESQEEFRKESLEELLKAFVEDFIILISEQLAG